MRDWLVQATCWLRQHSEGGLPGVLMQSYGKFHSIYAEVGFYPDEFAKV